MFILQSFAFTYDQVYVLMCYFDTLSAFLMVNIILS